MIISIEGTLLESSPVMAVIENQGLGYEVNIPLSTAENLPLIGERVKLHTLAVYREDSATLYGFSTRDERDFFRLLVEKVSGVGPKIALSILSKLPVSSLKDAIAAGNVALLSKCPGIGKKTAERLIIELKDKVLGSSLTSAQGASSSTHSQAPMPHQDAIAALITLGYKAADAEKAIAKAAKTLGAEATTETLIRSALGS